LENDRRGKQRLVKPDRASNTHKAADGIGGKTADTIIAIVKPRPVVA
jgi:hypothetical protein